MALYRFSGIDQQGGTQSGTVEGESARHVRALIKARGIVVLELSAIEARPTSILSWSRRKLSSTDRVLLLRQLASLLNAGIAIDEALEALAKQSEKEKVKQVVLALRSAVLGGASLGTALKEQGRDFPPTVIALVSAGEQSGQLGWVMERVAEYAESRDHLNQKVWMALAYPAIVSFVAIGIVAFLMTHVVPQVVAVFIHNHQSLPWLTRFMINLSNFLIHWGGVVLVFLLGLTLLWQRALQHEPTRMIWDQQLLRMPIVGKLIRGFNTERFASTLAILVNSGVPILTALQGAADTLTNRVLKRHVEEASMRVREGTGLAKALSVSQQFPPVLLQLIQSGEATGHLSDMLSRAALSESRDLERRLLLLTTFLEPLLILFMGLIVATIVLAVMMPIMEINQMIH